MRHLVLWRRQGSEEDVWAAQTIAALRQQGLDVVGEPCETWMPPQTQGVSRELNQRMDWLCRGFGIVHAFGPRVVCACAAAFGSNRPWIASLLEDPAPYAAWLRLAAAVAAPTAALRPQHRLARVIAPPWLPEPLKEGACEPGVRQVGLLTEHLSGDEVFAVKSAMQRAATVLPTARLALHGPGTLSLTAGAVVGVGDAPTVEEFCASCDAVVFPHSPGRMSLDLLRCLAAGTPALIEESHPAADWVQHGRNGVIYEPDALADSLLSLLRDDFTLENLAHGTRVVLDEEHSFEQQGIVLKGLYEDAGI